VSDDTSGRSIRAGAIVAALVGVAGAAYLVFRIGFHGIAAAAVSVGWSGFALLCIYALANFALLGLAWLVLTSRLSAATALTFSWARAVRDSAGDVLPFSQFGGMVIGARAAILRGISPSLAFGSTVVDITMEVVAQIVFIITGLTILLLRLPGVGSVPMVKTTFVGIAVAAILVGAFVVVQRHGFSLLQRIARRLLPAAAAHAGELDGAVNGIHEHPLRMAAGFVLHLAGWLSAAFGTWLALALIGARIGFVDAIAIESLVCAARSAAVFIPAAIGVQEAGYAVMMPLFGLPAEIGIAVSLLKRGREIAVGIPVLLSWQIAEGRHALAAPGARLRGGVYD
jgi:putative membrane protein